MIYFDTPLNINIQNAGPCKVMGGISNWGGINSSERLYYDKDITCTIDTTSATDAMIYVINNFSSFSEAFL